MMRRIAAVVVFAALVLGAGSSPAAALEAPGPLADLQLQMRAISNNVPGLVGIAVRDLATGTTSGVNANVKMPAASTIKIPVMVEVFRQMSFGRLSTPQQVTLQAVRSRLTDGATCATRRWARGTRSSNCCG